MTFIIIHKSIVHSFYVINYSVSVGRNIKYTEMHYTIISCRLSSREKEDIDSYFPKDFLLSSVALDYDEKVVKKGS